MLGTALTLWKAVRMRHVVLRESISRPAALVVLALVQAVACGGEMVDDVNGNSGGHPGATTGVHSGAAPATSLSGVGSASSSSKSTETICFGEEKPAPNEPVVTYRLDPVSSSECTIVVPIPDTLRLNPAKAFIYFKGSEGARSQIPYLGEGLGACVNAKAYGGWYATNINGGTSSIGLCNCSCNTARTHGFYLDVAVSGIPK